MKPYNSFGDHLRKQFGEKVYKISIDAGFTCPNRDGTLSTEGCIFCNETGSASPGVDAKKDIFAQIEDGKKALYKKYKAKKYLAYFQAFSSTYAPVEKLQTLYLSVLDDPDIVGLSVSTRPDCLDDKKIKLLQKISESHYTWLELGLQSTFDKTLKLINRHDSYENFKNTVRKAKHSSLKLCAHIILGLPGENFSDMQETVNRLIDLKIDGIKFHLLHIIKNTPIEKLYREGGCKLFSREEYIETVVKLVKSLPEEIIIHRLTAEGPSKDVIAPLWSLEKRNLLREIEEKLGAKS